MASSSLTALPSAAVVEETLLRETERGIVLRFGRAADPLTRRADAQLRGVAQRSDELLEIFTVDLDEIAEFTATYELHDPFSILCFWRGRVLQLDTGFGLEPKITALGASSAHLADVLVGAVGSGRGEAPPPAARGAPPGSPACCPASRRASPTRSRRHAPASTRSRSGSASMA